MPRLKSCPSCATPRSPNLRRPCPACGHQATGKRGSTASDRRARAAAIAAAQRTRRGLRCERCDIPLTGGTHTHYDHVVAKVLGGTDAMANRQLLCARCNLRKGARA